MIDQLSGYEPVVRYRVYLWFCGFNAKFLALQLSLVHSIMRPIAIDLTLPHDYFDAAHYNPGMTMRLLHFPPINIEECDDRYLSASTHIDYGSHTILAELDKRSVLVERSLGHNFGWRLTHFGNDVFDTPREFSSRMRFSTCCSDTNLPRYSLATSNEIVAENIKQAKIH